MATALVTGGAIHVGEILCLHLADMGYDIALHYNTSETASEEVADFVRAKGRNCEVFAADFLKSKGEGLIERVSAEMEDISLLINCASVFEKADLCNSGLDLVERSFAVNFTAPFILMRDFAKFSKQGLIINILDQSIKKALPEHAIYSVSKAALASLTKAAAREFAPDIRVAGIAPGIVLPHTQEDEIFFDKQKNNVPLQKAGTVETVIKAVDYIIGNDFVTGDILFVDGGQSL